MGVGQKRKWIALSANYATLSPAEQAKLHERMSEWVAIGAQHRSTARINFAQAQALPPGERKAQWEAYQALSPEEKRRLTAEGSSRPAGAAPAVKPVPPSKLAVLPVTRAEAPRAPASRAAAARTDAHKAPLAAAPTAVTSAATATP